MLFVAILLLVVRRYGVIASISPVLKPSKNRLLLCRFPPRLISWKIAHVPKRLDLIRLGFSEMYPDAAESQVRAFERLDVDQTPVEVS